MVEELPQGFSASRSQCQAVWPRIPYRETLLKFEGIWMKDNPRDDEAVPHPLREGARAFRGCGWMLLGTVLGGGVCAALWRWGGTPGRSGVAALGFGVVGALLPWFSGTEPKSSNQERFMLWLSAVAGVCGAVFGGWLGMSGDELPWWVFASAVAAATVGGAAIGAWAHRRAGRP